MSRHLTFGLCGALVFVAITAGTATAPPPPEQDAPPPAGQPAPPPDEGLAPPPEQPPPEPQATSRPSRHDRRVSEEEVLAVLKERLPLRYERLMEIKDSDPNEYRRHLRWVRGWYTDWRRMPPNVQDADVLQQTTSVRIWRLVDTMRKAETDADRAELQSELAALVEQQFDAETVVMAYRLEQMAEHLERMREHLAKRRENHDAEVAERLEHLLRATTQPAGEWPPRPRRRDD